MQPTRRIDDERIEHVLASVLDGVAAYRLHVAVFFRERRQPRGLADDFELFDRRGPVDIRRHQHGISPALTQIETQLSGQRGLSRTLQPDQHDDAGKRVGKVDRHLFFAHQLFELIEQYLYDLLTRRDAGQNLLPDGLLLDVFDELPRDLVVDIRLQEDSTDFPKRIGDVLFGQPSAASQLADDAVEFFAKLLKHLEK